MTRTETFSRIVTAILVLPGMMLTGAVDAAAADLPPGGTFWDDDGSIHEANIEAIAAIGITQGCNPPYNDKFCPQQAVTRGQMATFLVKALELPAGPTGAFTDTTGSVHEGNINSLAAAGITTGCNPPANDRFCPDQAVTREQMASFLVRAFRLPQSDFEFIDIEESIHAHNIRSLAAARITVGCNPPDNTRFCPTQVVTRAQMASFLTRALSLDPISPPPPPPVHLISRFTTYHACCEPRVDSVQSAARKLNGVVIDPRETFSMLSLLNNVVYSGYCQTSTTLLNSAYWGGLDVVTFQPHPLNYSRYPDGLEATLVPWSVDLKIRNSFSRPVEIRSSYTGTSVTVEIWGNNDGLTRIGSFKATEPYHISTTSEGGPEAIFVRSSIQDLGERTYRVNRWRYRGEDLISTESWTWTYRS